MVTYKALVGTIFENQELGIETDDNQKVLRKTNG